ncbi:sigma factor-like helix-turn-helix DNA-binding protein [Kribbella sp. NPDC050124]|uniref:sigma factor-like helix-turn-helix DNA-binding protein n=1 Tax=Kribbella sp. NPDC050124 TaxID=3364114 RepID=UPI0037B28943
MAALLLLERLTPLERAVFVLREVFGFGLPEVADAVGRSEAACRQLAVRARRHMDVGRPRFEADRRERQELAARFFAALRDWVGGCTRTLRLRGQPGHRRSGAAWMHDHLRTWSREPAYRRGSDWCQRTSWSGCRPAVPACTAVMRVLEVGRCGVR